VPSAQGFASQAQRDKWKQLVSEGHVTQEQYDAKEALSPPNLPQRAAPRRRTVGPSRSADAAKIGDTRY
jgi:hypothetical protein